MLQNERVCKATTGAFQLYYPGSESTSFLNKMSHFYKCLDCLPCPGWASSQRKLQNSTNHESFPWWTSFLGKNWCISTHTATIQVGRVFRRETDVLLFMYRVDYYQCDLFLKRKSFLEKYWCVSTTTIFLRDGWVSQVRVNSFQNELPLKRLLYFYYHRPIPKLTSFSDKNRVFWPLSSSGSGRRGFWGREGGG